MNRLISEVCGSCKFFQSPDNADHGHCRRYPIYQMKSKNAWCGEYAIHWQYQSLERQVEPKPDIKRKRGRPFKNPQPQEQVHAEAAQV